MADGGSRAWQGHALQLLAEERKNSVETRLLALELPGAPGITLYLKDEMGHPTGSLKHRLAASLFSYALCNGWIGPGTTIVEASSGSTAVSEAYFARLLGLPFVAVVPESTSAEKLAAIEAMGGRCRLVAGQETFAHEAQRVAAELGGHYMDQFTYAERATDWRRGNIADAMFDQLRGESWPSPDWIVCGAGTGGTSATIGRYLRHRGLPSRLCLADPEMSLLHRNFADRAIRFVDGPPSLIEGIGPLSLLPSYLPSVIDRVETVADAASVAATRSITTALDTPCGGSTGTNIWASLVLAYEMKSQGRTGAIATLLCDSGDRYASTYFDDRWLVRQGLELAPYEDFLAEMLGQ